MINASRGLLAFARTFLCATIAAAGLAGCCGGKTESKGPSFRSPTAERTTDAPSAAPSASHAEQPAEPPRPSEPAGDGDRRLSGLGKRLGKLRVDPDAPKFASATLLATHYRKHGLQMGFASEEDYLAAAQALLTGKDAERFQRNGDQLFFRATTGEFAVLGRRGALRTYFVPNDPPGYWQRQKDGTGARDEDEPRGRRVR